MRLLFACVCTLFGIGAANVATDDEPYHQIQVHFEEGRADRLAGEEEWEERKAESKAASARAEFEQRASAQEEALQAHIRAFRGKALAKMS